MGQNNVVKIASFTSIADCFNAAKECYISYCKSRNLSKNTLEYYALRLLAFERFLASIEVSNAPKDLTTQTIRAFLTHETEHKSATTASHSYIALSAFFTFLVNDGYLETDPMKNVDKPRRRKTIINTFSSEQIECILASCEKDYIGTRDRAMITMLVDCGLRASELAGLKLQDFDWTECIVLVLGKGDKERIVPFGQATRQALSSYLNRRGEQETDAIFVSTLGAKMDRHRIREIIEKRCQTAGINGVRCSPHTFRHTFAVMYLRAGGDVFSLQKLLGHSSLDMTRRYAELSQTDVQDKHRLYSPADRLQNAAVNIGRKRLK